MPWALISRPSASTDGYVGLPFASASARPSGPDKPSGQRPVRKHVGTSPFKDDGSSWGLSVEDQEGGDVVWATPQLSSSMLSLPGSTLNVRRSDPSGCTITSSPGYPSTKAIHSPSGDHAALLT